MSANRCSHPTVERVNYATAYVDHCLSCGAEWVPRVAVEDVERILSETSQFFAGDHLNAGVVVGQVRKRLRDHVAVSGEQSQ